MAKQQNLPSGLTVRKNKFKIELWRNGKCVHRETLEKLSAANERHTQTAIKIFDDRKARITAGLSPKQKRSTDSAYFEGAAGTYLLGLKVKNRKESVLSEAALILDQYWVPVFGKLPLSEIDHLMIIAVLADMVNIKTGQPLAVKTKINRLSVLSGLMRFHNVNPNPCDVIHMEKEQEPEIERYTLNQRAALIRELDGQAKVYFALLFGCGLRPGEALGLEWTDYNGKKLAVQRQITRGMKVGSTKTRRRRLVDMPTWTQQILNNHPTRFQGGLIFVNKQGDNFKATHEFNIEWKRAHQKCRIPYRIPYICRHTRAAELLSIGVEPGRAAQQLGHSLEMFYRKYQEWIDEYRKDTSDDGIFEGKGIEYYGEVR